MQNANFDISVVGRQSAEGDTSEISLYTTGKYETEGTARLISYEEYENNDPTQKHTSILHVGENRVVLTRMDSDHPNITELILEMDKRHQCLYFTRYGAISMGVYTTVVDNKLNDKGGEIKLRYTLDIDSNYTSTNELDISIRPSSKKRDNSVHLKADNSTGSRQES